MNYAYVRLNGTVINGPQYDSDAQTLRFTIADDTGEIQAIAFQDVTQDLLRAKKIPTIGDKIALDGTLRVRDDFTSIQAVSADHLELTPPNPTEINIGEIAYTNQLQYVQIQGDVRNVREPYQGLTLITLGDETGEIDVAMTGDTENLFGALPTYQLGDVVEARGIVSYYHDTPQLVLRNASDFKLSNIENTTATISKITTLDVSRLNQRVRIAGQVSNATNFSQGMRATLTDDSGDVTLLLWQDVVSQIQNATDLKKGAEVEAIGKLQQYRGAFEVVPDNAADIQIQAAAAQPAATPSAGKTPRSTRTPTAIPQARTIHSVTQADQDTTVILQGDITRASTFSQGMRLSLTDASGSITLLIWSDVLANISFRDALVEGATLRVTGKINVFDNALEIVPQRAEDVELLKLPSLPIIPSPIGSLSSDNLDQTVLIRGTVSGISDFSQGKYVTLKDDSGTIQVTIFSDVWRRIQDKMKIGVTASVRGKVNLFQGKLEIVANNISF